MPLVSLQVYARQITFLSGVGRLRVTITVLPCRTDMIIAESSLGSVRGTIPVLLVATRVTILAARLPTVATPRRRLCMPLIRIRVIMVVVVVVN